MRFSNILCMVDASAASPAALAAAIELARESGGALSLLNLFQMPFGAYMPGYPTSRLPALSPESIGQAAAEALLADCGAAARARGVEPTSTLAMLGHRGDLGELARLRGHDVIVVPADTRSWLQRWFGGGDAARGAVRDAPCPVLVIPPACSLQLMRAAILRDARR